MAKHFFNAEDPVLPIYFPGVLLRLLQDDGIPPERILRGSGLENKDFDDEDQRISFNEHVRFTKSAIKASNNIHLGWRFGKQINITALGMLGFAAMSSNTLESAVETITKYFKIRAPLYNLYLTKDSDREGMASLEIEEALDLGDIRYFLLSSAAMGAQTVVGFFVGETEMIEYCQMTCPEPEGWDTIKDTLNFPVEFNASSATVYFKKSLLQKPLKTSDPQTAKSTMLICEQMLKDIESQSGIVREVRQYILANSNHFPSLDETAEHLCISSRTLRRDLKKSGTTYQQVLDRIRKTKAIDLLLKTNKTVGEIAFEMGYKDVSNFGSAFKRWTGKSPGSYRS